MEVRFIGREDTSWMMAQDLRHGSEQVSMFEIWDDDPNDYIYRDIILDSSDLPITWYAAAHEESTAVAFPVEHVEYLYHLGWCRDLCCCLVYVELWESCGYVPVAQLPIKN